MSGMRVIIPLQKKTLSNISNFAVRLRKNSNIVSPVFRLKMHNSTTGKTYENNEKSKATTNKDHLQVTATQQRDSGIHEVYVAKMTKLSSSVKGLELRTDMRPVPFSFKPGQWVDLFIPGVEKVGGFSMTSSPKELSERGSLQLAVKYSDHAPAKWVHEKCREGDKVTIRVGGDFFLDLNSLPANKTTHIVLIAGGVGINPLASMISAIGDHDFSSSETPRLGKVVLFYSAKTSQELIFKEKFDSIQNTSFQSYYFLTKSSSELTFRCTTGRRITRKDLHEGLANASMIPTKDHEDILCYVCGPSEMIKFAESALWSLDVKSIHYENWWKED